MNKNKSRRGIFAGLTLAFLIVLSIFMISTNICNFIVTKNNVTNDYKNYSTQIAKQTQISIENLLTTVDASYSKIYSDDEFMNLLSTNSNDDEIREQVRNQISDKLTELSLANSFKLISGITFYSDKGTTASFPIVKRTTSEANKLFEDIKSNEWYKKVESNKDKPIWIGPHKEKIVEGNSDLYVSSVGTIKDDNDNIIGVLKIDVKASRISEVLSCSKIGNKGYLCIISNDVIIGSNSEAKIGTKVNKEIRNSLLSKNKEFTFVQDEVKMHAIKITSNSNDWSYVACIPEKELSNTAMKIEKISIVIAIICLIISLLFSINLTWLISDHIKKLIKNTKEVAKGNLTIKSEEYIIKEFNELSNYFNIMVDNLKKLVNNSTISAYLNKEIAYKLSNISKEIVDISDQTVQAVRRIDETFKEQVRKTEDCLAVYNNLSENIDEAIIQINNIFNESNKSIMIISDGKDTIKKINEKREINKRNIEKISEEIAEFKKKDSWKNSEGQFGGEINSFVNTLSCTILDTKEKFEEDTKLLEEALNNLDLIYSQLNNTIKSMYDTKKSIANINSYKKVWINNINQIESNCHINAAEVSEVLAFVDNKAETVEKMNLITEEMNNKADELIEKLKIFNINGETPGE